MTTNNARVIAGLILALAAYGLVSIIITVADAVRGL